MARSVPENRAWGKRRGAATAPGRPSRSVRVGDGESGVPVRRRENETRVHRLVRRHADRLLGEGLARLAEPFLRKDGCDPGKGAPLAKVVALLKERVSTLQELAGAAVYFYRALEPSEELKRQHYSAATRPALVALRDRLAKIDWNRENISAGIKAVLAEHKLKMPQLAMPLRVMVSGATQTPPIDVTLELIGRGEVLARLDKQLQAFPQ